MVFCIILFSFFISFCLYARRYNNPYKLIFIFGKKGAGKSMYMCRCMLKDLKKGWTVYTDIQDINIPGVRIIKDSHELAKFRPCENSALYLDEVGISFDNRSFKTFDAGLRDFFKLQRKYRCKVIMNSQSFDIDKKIRDVTDSMILMQNIMNCIAICRPIRRSITLTEPSADSESRIADRLRFTGIFSWKIFWMPKYHKFFNSFDAPYREELKYIVVPEVLDNEVLAESSDTPM